MVGSIDHAFVLAAYVMLTIANNVRLREYGIVESVSDDIPMDYPCSQVSVPFVTCVKRLVLVSQLVSPTGGM